MNQFRTAHGAGRDGPGRRAASGRRRSSTASSGSCSGKPLAKMQVNQHRFAICDDQLPRRRSSPIAASGRWWPARTLPDISMAKVFYRSAAVHRTTRRQLSAIGYAGENPAAGRCRLRLISTAAAPPGDEAGDAKCSGLMPGLPTRRPRSGYRRTTPPCSSRSACSTSSSPRARGRREGRPSPPRAETRRASESGCPRPRRAVPRAVAFAAWGTEYTIGASVVTGIGVVSGRGGSRHRPDRERWQRTRSRRPELPRHGDAAQGRLPVINLTSRPAPTTEPVEDLVRGRTFGTHRRSRRAHPDHLPRLPGLDRGEPTSRMSDYAVFVKNRARVFLAGPLS
jgi:hypothetical protein